MDKRELAEKAEVFKRLHETPPILILPNAWDAGSAAILAEAGFPALATTSAGVAHSLGRPDGERVSREDMLTVAGRIAARVSVPVTADLEAGYGPRPEDVADTVRAALAAGLVGANFEDRTGRPEQPLYDLGEAVERIRAGREAADAEGVPFVINARTDVLLLPGDKGPEALDEAIGRANAYRAAGADCLFVPGRLDEDTIGRLAAGIEGPLNVLGVYSGQAGPSLARLTELGVARVSLGGSLSLACLGLVRRVAKELLEQGTFSYAEGALTNAEVNKLLAR